LCVLKWILCSLRSQFYVRQDVNAGMRKPLNAFLGELFFGKWTDDTSTAQIITEQVRYGYTVDTNDSVHNWYYVRYL
jgi:oxysterol-binding protein-related protein 9/10/11